MQPNARKAVAGWPRPWERHSPPTLRGPRGWNLLAPRAAGKSSESTLQCAGLRRPDGVAPGRVNWVVPGSYPVRRRKTLVLYLKLKFQFKRKKKF